MTTWFITRHPGALEWAHRHGLSIDRHIVHMDPADVRPGDVVLGTLPVNLAADVCAKGARFGRQVQGEVEIARGRELSADDLERYGARLEEYRVAAPTTGKGQA